MDVFDIKIGTKLELQLFEDSQETFGKKMSSKLEAFENKYSMLITAPMKDGNIYPVHTGTLLDVYFLGSNKKKGNNYYRFSAKIISRGKKDDNEYLKIHIKSDIEKIQRRQYYRLECTIPIKYRLLKSSEDENKDLKHGITKDFSGGGMCIILDEELNVGKAIECEFTINEHKKISFIGKIKRIESELLKGRKQFKTAVKITKIDENIREELVKYIFKEQRELRKKGLI